MGRSSEAQSCRLSDYSLCGSRCASTLLPGRGVGRNVSLSDHCLQAGCVAFFVRRRTRAGGPTANIRADALGLHAPGHAFVARLRPPAGCTPRTAPSRRRPPSRQTPKRPSICENELSVKAQRLLFFETSSMPSGRRVPIGLGRPPVIGPVGLLRGLLLRTVGLHRYQAHPVEANLGPQIAPAPEVRTTLPLPCGSACTCQRASRKIVMPSFTASTRAEIVCPSTLRPPGNPHKSPGSSGRSRRPGPPEPRHPSGRLKKAVPRRDLVAPARVRTDPLIQPRPVFPVTFMRCARCPLSTMNSSAANTPAGNGSFRDGSANSATVAM